MPADVIILLFGVYLVGGGLTMLLAPMRLKAMITQIGDWPALSYLAGAIMAPLGATILYGFHDFETWPRTIAAILGVGLLIEGWMLMVAPNELMALARNFLFSDRIIRILGLPVLAAAIAAIAYGLP